MKSFELEHAASFEEAAQLKASGKTDLLSGGTDLLNVYKHGLLAEHPDKVVDLKKIPNGSGIEEKDGMIRIGALTTLTDIASNELINDKAEALAAAAHSVATPLIRNRGTIGGNICQDVRCWFYRYPHEVGGRMNCSRKGGDLCYAVQGENRYHSIFGGMKTHADPCSKGCPSGTDIPAYMEMIRQDRWDEAADIIMRANPIPMCTSRICPHPCQDQCNQNRYGECVSIHCVERTLGDYILANKNKFYAKPENETGKKVAVIGAGPGGLTCAYFMRKQGHSVTLFDNHEKAGGVLYYGIPHYRLPKNIVEETTSAIENMGVDFRMNTNIGTDITLDELLEQYDSIYFGTGAWKQPILGITGEEMTQFGLNFLVEVNSFLRNAIDNDVLVCGGGNVAMDVALTAKRMGAKNVKLVCLEQENEMPASKEEIARAKEEGVVICNGWGLKKVVTDTNGKVSGLESMKCTSVYDENHRFHPVYDEDTVEVFDATTIILATGQRVDISFLGKFADQLKTERGLIGADQNTFQTENDKIFAGGDAVTGPNIAIRAINAGKNAAMAMSEKLGSKITYESTRTGFLTFDDKLTAVKENAKLKERAIEDRTLRDEDAMSLTMEEAKNEAGRCMNCGCYSVNASDIANVLLAVNANIVTNKKTIQAKDFFTTKLKAYDMLDNDELVTAVEVPELEGYVTGYNKDRMRPAIDFALLSVAYAYKLVDGVIEDISIVLGGAAPVPVKLTEVEALVKGRKPSAELADEAGKLAVKDCVPMTMNRYKIVDAEVMVRRLIEAM